MASTGKIVSLTQTKTSWEKAETWCSELGSGWRLPTVTELKEIYKNINVLNAALDAVGKEIVSPYSHWSIQEYKSTYAWVVFMGGENTTFTNKYYDFYVRAVSAF